MNITGTVKKSSSLNNSSCKGGGLKNLELLPPEPVEAKQKPVDSWSNEHSSSSETQGRKKVAKKKSVAR